MLQDAVASRAFPQVSLTEIFRQAEQSAVVRGAHEIMHGARGMGLHVCVCARLHVKLCHSSGMHSVRAAALACAR